MVVVKEMVTVFCKEQGDNKVKKAIGWMKQNGIKYQVKEVNSETFTFPIYLHFLSMTVEGMGEILTKKGDGRRSEVLTGEFSDCSLKEIYEIVVNDPEYLDLPLMIDELGRTATLGTRRDNKEYDNLTVFRSNEPIVIGEDGYGEGS